MWAYLWEYGDGFLQLVGNSAPHLLSVQFLLQFLSALDERPLALADSVEELRIFVPHYSIGLSSPQAVMKHSRGLTTGSTTTSKSNKGFPSYSKISELPYPTAQNPLRAVAFVKGIFSYFCLGHIKDPSSAHSYSILNWHEKQAGGKGKTQLNQFSEETLKLVVKGLQTALGICSPGSIRASAAALCLLTPASFLFL